MQYFKFYSGIYSKKDVFIFTRLSERVLFLDIEMKLQIFAPNELTNSVCALRMKLALRSRVKFGEIHARFREG